MDDYDEGYSEGFAASAPRLEPVISDFNALFAPKAKEE